MAERILVVDDDPETVRIMQLFLKRLGYDSIAAHTGALAIEMATREHPDLIILDVMMPGMDGFEVSRSLHRLADTAQIPILMVTARATPEEKTRGYESGADIYLTKPVHAMDLQANIRALLEQRRARKMALAGHGYLVGVIAAKGGTGVSTVALNLAVTYAKQYKVPAVAMEMRPGQGTWADELSLSNNHALGNLLKLPPQQITQSMVEDSCMPALHGARLLLSTSFEVDPVFHNDPGQYEAILYALSQVAPLAVLDIGVYFSPVVPVILDHCSEVIVVTEPQELAVRQTCRLVDLLRARDFGGSRPLTVISYNRARSETSMTVSQMENTLSRPVALGFPPAQELATYALRQQLPLGQAQPESLTARQFEKLAELVKAHVEGV